MFHVKICGITRPQDAREAVMAGCDAIGLNFYPAGKRYLRPELAPEIVTAARTAASETRSSVPALIGVFVNSPVEDLIEIFQTLGLDGIQLHGDEDLDFLIDLRQQLAATKRASSCLIRAIRTAPDSQRDGENLGFLEEIGQWERAEVDAVLLDAAEPGHYGGTGKTINWNSVAEMANQISVPIVLAGGLTPENVQNAIQISGVRSVDVASGVESAPGVKDRSQMQHFVQQAWHCFGDVER